MHYLFFDCETSGLDSNIHIPLTAYFCVLDNNFNLIDELSLQLKPEEGVELKFEQEALEVTGINIENHINDPNTITLSKGGALLSSFLEKHKIKGKRKHYRPSGQNIEFDINFIHKHLLPRDKWSKTVHHNTLDTLRILTFLQDIQVLPVELGSLGSLVEYFGVTVGKAHNAKEDVKMTIDVYKKMRDLIGGMKKNTLSSIESNSLLEIVEF